MIPRAIAIPSAVLLSLVACAEKQDTKVEAPVVSTPACPEGAEWDGKSCVGRVVTCPAGLRFEKGVGCVATEPVAQTPAAAPEPRPRAEEAIDPPPATPAFPQSYAQKSGLLRMHFPSDLVANPDSNNLTFLEPTQGAPVSTKSLVTFTSNPDPISQDPNEYARVLQGARQKALTGYRLLSTIPGRCFRNMQGVETRWEFDEGNTVMRGRACAFVHHKHGYSFMYAYDPARPKDEAYLRAVIEAVEVTD